MFRRLKTYLNARKLEHAKTQRLKAWEAHHEAIRRGDTRRQHETYPDLCWWTNEKLRLELGR